MLSDAQRKELRAALASKGFDNSSSLADQLADILDAAAKISPAAHVAPVVTANATDLASAEALANANKVAINAIIANMIASGEMAAS